MKITWRWYLLEIFPVSFPVMRNKFKMLSMGKMFQTNIFVQLAKQSMIYFSSLYYTKSKPALVFKPINTKWLINLRITDTRSRAKLKQCCTYSFIRNHWNPNQISFSKNGKFIRILGWLIQLKEELLEHDNTGETQYLYIRVDRQDSPHFILHLCHFMDGIIIARSFGITFVSLEGKVALLS